MFEVIGCVVFDSMVTLVLCGRVRLLVFDSATSVMEPRRHIIATVMDYVQRAMRKTSGAEDHCRDANVLVDYASVPRQSSGSLDCGAFVIYYAFKIITVRNKWFWRCVPCSRVAYTTLCYNHCFACYNAFFSVN
jgi:Ulp1 family protease